MVLGNLDIVFLLMIVLRVLGRRRPSALSPAERREAAVMSGSAGIAVIAMSFALISFMTHSIPGQRAGLLLEAVALVVFVVCSVISIRSFRRL